MTTGILIALAIIALFLVYLYFSFRKMKNAPAVAESARIVTLNDKNFRAETGKGVVLVDFWAEWCMPCKVMGPVLNKLAEDETFGAVVAKLNVDHFPSVSQKFNIRGIPTIIVFKNGKEVERIVGVKPGDFLVKQVNKYL
jgi:thioredoxin 1